MDELDKNIPDDFWRKAFDEAAEPLPPRVWATIERRLDDEADGSGIIPLWGWGLASSRPFTWSVGIAAAVALLLVGWWAMTPQSTSSSVAQRQQADSSPAMADRRANPGTSSGYSNPKAATEPSVEESVAASASTQPLGNPATNAITGNLTVQPSGESVAQTSFKPAFRQVLSSRGMRTRAMAALSAASTPGNTLTTHDFMQSVTQATVVSYAPVQANGTAAMASTTDLSFTKLTGKPLRLRRLGNIQRIVWANPAWVAANESAVERIQKRSKAKDMWASASVMPGAFNPMVAIRSTQLAYALTTAASPSTGQATVSSRANFSVAYQAGAGVQLNDHWSVESGIGYLAGRSTVETPTQASMASIQAASANRATSNLYVDALRNSSHPSGNVQAAVPSYDYNLVSNTTKQVYDLQNRQSLTNAYQYVQVPVQVGYQLRPRKRLSLAVLGGLITNIFIRNTVGDEVVITAKDGVYRPVSWAATVGARFRYRPSQRWSASMAGLYQPSLGLSTQPDSQVQSQPTSAGMSFGVDYHF